MQDNPIYFQDIRNYTQFSKKEGLLKKFYTHFLQRFFPCQNQLDSIEYLANSLEPKPDVLSSNLISIILCLNKSDDQILGGIVFELYHVSNFGLITYFCVDTKYRKYNIGRNLINYAEKSLDEFSYEYFGEKTNAILLEMSSPYRSIVKDSFPPEKRVKVFKNLGCSLVDVFYVQPPLGLHLKPDTSLVLICLNRENKQFIEGNKLVLFFHEFYETHGSSDHVMLKKMTADAENRRIPLKSLTLETISYVDRKYDSLIPEIRPNFTNSKL